jgi:hypothetical protein
MKNTDKIIFAQDQKELATLKHNDAFENLSRISKLVNSVEIERCSTPTRVKLRKLKVLLDKSLFILDDLKF